ncbi:MAG: amino acid adenylation domain-containing protein [Streptomyces sp.]|uniref:amino acid adenylation domain-containing protein n=1 Tax=Streptomyces sp. TaxID=1931 RepID=UPI0025DB35EA|nr:amino acid adenylation domain-containing protein [Streptomyces sp.]MBW8799862.1 amino acid adenylation domain-containing protein [Streptomyces sp.]
MTESVYALLASHTVEDPGQPAVVDAQGLIDRRGLLDEVNRLAAELSRHRPADRLVGVHLERGRLLVAALLAVEAVGAAFLPLDPAVPRSRLRAFLLDSGADLLVTTSGSAGLLGAGPWKTVAADQPGPKREWSPAPDGDRVAYIMYTSGSTGAPKGVAVGQRSLQAFLAMMDAEVREEAPERVGERQIWQSVCSVGFDLSVIDFLWATSRGHTVVIGPNDPTGLFESGFADGTPAGHVTHAVLTPSTARLLCHDPATLAGLRRARVLMIGGEPFPSELVDLLRPDDAGPRLINVYGPTEATVWITRTEVSTSSAPPGFAGNSVAPAAFHVLDDDLSPLQASSEGTVFLSGPGIAFGYWRQGGRTAAAFLPDPTGTSGSRMYDTGDLGVVEEEGGLTIRGRTDRQVKIRGNRVELGEVEHAICIDPVVRSAACIVTAVAGMTAFVVAGETSTASVGEQILARLVDRLPRYMIPNKVIVVSEMPRVPNGKIDRAALERLLGAAG